MTSSPAPGSLPTWADQMRALEGVGDGLVEAWRPDGATPAEEAAMHVEGPEDALASNAELGNPETAPETENPGEA